MHTFLSALPFLPRVDTSVTSTQKRGLNCYRLQRVEQMGLLVSKATREIVSSTPRVFLCAITQIAIKQKLAGIFHCAAVKLLAVSRNFLVFSLRLLRWTQSYVCYQCWQIDSRVTAVFHLLSLSPLHQFSQRAWKSPRGPTLTHRVG